MTDTPQPSGEDAYAEIDDGAGLATGDPDLDAARGLSVEREAEALTTDELRPEEESVEFEAPFEPTRPTAIRETPADAYAGETLEDRLAQEEPDLPLE